MNLPVSRSISAKPDDDWYEIDQAEALNVEPVLNLERLWRRAVEKRYILLGIVLLAILGSIVLTLLQTPLYRSTSQIEISRVDNAAAAAVETTTSDFAESRDQQYYNTQYALLSSSAVAENVADALDLSRDEKFLDAFGLDASEIPLEMAAGILLQNVAVSPIEQSNLVDISFSSPAPQVSADIANAWATQFLQMNYDKRYGDTILSRKQLEQQLAEMRVKLEESEARLNAYANANEIIVTESTDSDGDTTRSTLLSSQLATISDALSEATVRRVSAESALRAGASADQTSSTEASSRLAEAQAQLAELQSTFGPEHQRVQAKQAEIRSLRQAVSGARSDAAGVRQAAYRSAISDEQELRRRYEQTKARYLAQQGNGVQYGILEREVRTNREIYDGLLQRYKELGTATAGSNNMQVVEEAKPASFPYQPSLMKNLLLGLLIGIALAAALIILLDRLDQTIRDPEDVRKRFNLKLLGVIPATEGEVIDAIADRHSIVSEAYASLRTSLQFGARESARKSILFTSTFPAEGKSSSALAVAKSLADVGEKVALVDLDLRRRGLSKILGLGGAENGAANFLQNVDEKALLSANKDFGFDFLPAGRSDVAPVVLLSSPKLATLIDQLEAEYDFVIVDGPPVIGIADALELSAAVDGSVYVIKANSGSNTAIRRSLERLRETDSNIIGGVLTQADSRNETYGYSYEYLYSYEGGDRDV